MKRLPPLPFSPPPPLHSLSIEAWRFTVFPALFNALTHWSDCAATESTVSGVTVGSVRGCGLMVFDRQYSLFMVLVSISRGAKQRPMRQPDESVLFICASVRVHCAARHVTIAKTFRNPPDHLVYNKGNIGFCVTVSTFSVGGCLLLQLIYNGFFLSLRQTVVFLWFNGLYMRVPFSICLTKLTSITRILCIPLQRHKAGDADERCANVWLLGPASPECNLMSVWVSCLN